MTGKYDDIIDLPHYVSKNRKHMSLHDRAAQFAPFAALSGYGSDITEASRLTGTRTVLDEYELALLDSKLRILQGAADDDPEVTVTYFVPDERKSGGEYRDLVGTISKIDEYERIIVMSDGTKIRMDDIFAIESEIFGSYF